MYDQTTTRYSRNFKVLTVETLIHNAHHRANQLKRLEAQTKKAIGNANHIVYLLRELCFRAIYSSRAEAQKITIPLINTIGKLEWYECHVVLLELAQLFSVALKALIEKVNNKTLDQFNYAEEKLGWYRYCVWRLKEDLEDKGVYCALCNQEASNSRFFDWCAEENCQGNCAFSQKCLDCDQRPKKVYDDRFSWPVMPRVDQPLLTLPMTN